MTESFVPVLIMMVFAVVLGAVLLSLASFVGKKSRNPIKLAAYESGVPPLDENRKRVNIKFFQIAMVFIIFDIEAAFLFPWAVIYREAVQGPGGGIVWFIFFEMLVFILLLAAGYVYIWKRRTFDWK
jgi:NADH-quinone oxidoreductase subunit A